MSDHLPECFSTNPVTPDASCICPWLRACEARVLNEYQQQHDGISERYFQQIRNAALDAARDAVAAVRDTRGDQIDMHDSALAAIDALRGAE